MAKFYLRTLKKEGESNLYIDVNRPKLGIRWKVNTRIKVSVVAWNKAQTSAKALNNYLSTDEGKAVKGKADMCESVIKDYLENINDASNANREELESQIEDYVNTDLKERREELDKLRVDEKKIEEEQNRQRLGEVLRYFDYFLDAMKKGETHHGNSKLYKKSSISAWNTFGKHLRGFLESTSRTTLTFDDIDLRTANAFLNYLEKKDMMMATITQQINHFRKLCNQAAKEGVNRNAVSLKVWESHNQEDDEKRAEIVLSESEINALYDLKLTGYVEQCRDLWILGFFSVQRVSDYSELSRENFSVNDYGTPIIRLRQRKTGTEVEVPIWDNRVYEICRKYDYRFPPLKRDAINRGIKAACKMLAESVPSMNDWQVTLLTCKEREKEKWFVETRKKVEAGELILHGEESKRYKRCLEYATEHDSGDLLYRRDYKGDVIRQRWELVTCHTTRRSAITWMHKMGVSDRNIMGSSGHKTLTVFENYLKMQTSEKATAVFEELKANMDIKKKEA